MLVNRRNCVLCCSRPPFAAAERNRIIYCISFRASEYKYGPHAYTPKSHDISWTHICTNINKNNVIYKHACWACAWTITRPGLNNCLLTYMYISFSYVTEHKDVSNACKTTYVDCFAVSAFILNRLKVWCVQSIIMYNILIDRDPLRRTITS